MGRNSKDIASQDRAPLQNKTPEHHPTPVANELGLLRGILLLQEIVVGGDLNGHVGVSCQKIERVHGGFGYGSRNAEGGDIVSTYFNKKLEHLITCKSGRHAIQIDFLFTRSHNIS